jgi:hypothetical protein
MFPLGESGDILADLDGFPVFDPNFFSMAPLFDTFTHRGFQPEISLSHSLLNVACDYGTDAQSQSFEIWNSGLETLVYSVTDDAEWLTRSPESGTSTGEHDTITVNFSTSGLNAGSYSATITISDTDASNSPQMMPVELTVNPPAGLSQISLATPANESILIFPPTFSWTAVGGTNNRFAVDLSYDWTFSWYWSTFENLRQPISKNNWAMPSTLWYAIPSGSYVYWRVRGADLDVTPLNVITGQDVWWFYRW